MKLVSIRLRGRASAWWGTIANSKSKKREEESMTLDKDEGENEKPISSCQLHVNFVQQLAQFEATWHCR